MRNFYLIYKIKNILYFVRMNKKLKLTLLTLSPIIASSIFLFSISCSKNDSSNEEENPSKPTPPIDPGIKNELEQLVNDGKIVLTSNSFGISKEYLDLYKDDIDEIQKLVFIKTKPDDLEIKLEVLPSITYDEQNNIDILVKLTNLKNQEEYQFFYKINEYGFLSANEYIKKVNEFIANSIYLKKEYQDRKIIELMEETKSNQSFIKKYIDTKSNLNQIIGIEYKLKIISQNLVQTGPDSNYLKLKLNLYDKKSKNDISPQFSAITPHLKLANYQKTTFTIINNTDLSQTISNSLSYSYFGKTIIRQEEVLETIKININLSGKNIIGALDFSPFKEIEFLSNARFSFNKITNLIFDPNSKIKNLNNSLFISNDIVEVNLPKQIHNFNPDCFDDSVKVFGLNNLENINIIFDENKNLKLNLVKDETELKNVLRIITKLLLYKNVDTINKVYLPSFASSILNNYNINCEEVIFDSEQKSFDSNIRNWKVKKIHIPSTILKIKSTNLPQSSSTTITRDINQEIKDLIKNEKLVIDSKTNIPKIKRSLWSEKNNLDDYFYTFSSIPLQIKEIEFIEANISDSSFSTSMLFFKNNLENKKIIFTNQVASINSDFFNSINNFAQSNNAQVERVKWLDETILDNQGILHIKKLYDNASINSANYNYYLTGYEDVIKSIDLTDISVIKSNLFSKLKLNNVTIQLDNKISEIESNAFYNSKINISINQDFNPHSIGNYAFSNSTLNGELVFSNLTSLGNNAFENTKITKAQFDNLAQISNYAFYNCSSLTNAIFSKANFVGNYSFYGTSIESFNFSNIIKIGNNAFANCGKITGIISLKDGVELGGSVFQGLSSSVTIENFDFKKYNIFTNLFSTSSISQVSSSKSFQTLSLSAGYNEQTKTLDWSKFTFEKWKDNEWFNDLILFSKNLKNLSEDQRIINELILPEEGEINSNWAKVLHSSITIKKLTWHSTSIKRLNGSLNAYHLGGAKILELDNGFFVGMHTIKSHSIPSTLINKTINLQAVEKVEDGVFGSLNNVIFENTENVKEIGSRSFHSSSTFSIGTNVKLKEDSFSTKGIPSGLKITRKKIFEYFGGGVEANFSLIYSQSSKVLDFSKIELLNPNDVTKLNLYKNISEYLLDGDVDKIILPNSYILSENFFNNLGTIEEIEFQNENQVILKNAFSGTKINQKPNQSKTSIILDQDNFFN